MKRQFIIYIFIFVLSILFIENGTAENNTIPATILSLIDDGKIEEAREQLNNFRREQPDNPLVLIYLAQIESDYNKTLWLYKEAETLADSALASEALFRRAETVFSVGDIVEAKSLYERLLKDYSESSFGVDSHYRLGLIMLAENSPQEAMKHFNQSLELDTKGSKRLLTMTGIMECYVVLEDWNEALKAAHAVLGEKDDLGSVTPRVLEVIAFSWLKLGNEDNAEKFNERLLKNYPYSYQAHALKEEGERVIDNAKYSFNSKKELSDSVSRKDFVSGNTTNLVKEEANFSVQVGAFEVRINALRLLRNLKDAGFDARVDMKTVNNKHLFVIRIGYFSTREEAEKTKEKVNKSIGIQSNVVILN